MSQTAPLASGSSLKRPFADLSNDGEEERRKMPCITGVNSAFIKTPNAGSRDAVVPSQGGAPKKSTWKSDDQTSPVQYNTEESPPLASESVSPVVVTDDDSSLLSTESVIDLMDDDGALPVNGNKKLYPSLNIFKQLAGGCVEMAAEVWDILLERERKYCLRKPPTVVSRFTAALNTRAEPTVPANFLEGWRRQHALNTDMRAMLMDWMIDVSDEYALQRVTLHAAINYVDRYISVVRGVTKSYLQLIGVTALFVASKVEEWEPPRAVDFVRQTDGAVTCAMMMAFEQVLIAALEWELHPISTPIWVSTFLQNIAIETGIVDMDDVLCTPLELEDAYRRAMRLCDLAVVHAKSLGFLYSDMAAAAVVICTDGDAIAFSPQQHVNIMGKTAEELRDCIAYLRTLEPYVLNVDVLYRVDCHLQTYNHELQCLTILAGRSTRRKSADKKIYYK